MGQSYGQLTADERAVLMVMLEEGYNQASIARRLCRNPGTISRELKRNACAAASAAYDAVQAGIQALARRFIPRVIPKLGADTALFAVVTDFLRDCWSPEQIAGILKRMWPEDRTRIVSHETIYNALYAMPRGELRKELISLLRHGRATRRPRSGGKDRRGQIPDMVNIAQRPAEVGDRVIPGHWEGDLIKGANNRSSVGTLVERTTRLVLLSRMTDATTETVTASFAETLRRVPETLRKTLTYDQGKEMSWHKQFTLATGVPVYFCDPHSPWQRGSNENTNGLLRQYMPKGEDLSQLTQNQLNAIAHSLNCRPRKMFGFRSPVEMFAELMTGSAALP
jgi:transposase, IS30 family